MTRIGKGQKALDGAHKHREEIERLLTTTPHWALRGWFLDWAESQLRRDRFYLFSDRERDVLAKELSSRMTPCDSWGGYTIDQLVDAAVTCRTDCSEEDDEFAPNLAARKTIGIAAVAHASASQHLPTRRWTIGAVYRPRGHFSTISGLSKPAVRFPVI